MNAYVPKVGDKVRATLGENVLVGVIACKEENGYYKLGVKQDEHVPAVYVDLNPLRWRFEPIVSVPTKFGAVIRNHGDKQLYVRHASDLELEDHVWVPLSAIDEVATDTEATAGGFTVLFDGVDE